MSKHTPSVPADMTTWWSITPSYNTNTIEPVCVTRETEACLYIYCPSWKRTSKTSKSSTTDQYFATYADARAALLARRESEVARIDAQLRDARRSLDVVVNMPAEPPDIG